MDDNQDELSKPITNPKKIKHNLFLVALIMIVVFLVIISQNDANQIFEILKKADYTYIGFGFIIMILYWLFTSLSLYLLMRKKTNKSVHSIDSLLISNSAFFFNGITPFSSGGQPFQIYSFRKCGVKTATSTGVLMMNFIIYQIALNIVSIVALILYFGELSKNVEGFNILVVIGTSINFAILVGLILMAVSKRFRSICNFLISKICKLKFLRKKEASIIEKVNTFVEDFQVSFKSLFKSIGVLSITLVFQVLALALQFSVPFFIFKALGIGIGIGELLKVMSLSAFALTFMIWIPTPGASGGAEWAFSELFPALIPSVTGAITASATLLWRFLTYYLSIIIGLISFIIFERRHKARTQKLSED